MNILGVAWIGLVSDDPALRAFYRDTLGLPLRDEAPTYAEFALDGHARLEILASATPSAGRQRPDAPAIGLLVADLDASLQELEAAGVALTTPVLEWAQGEVRHRWAYFHDPAGTVLLLLERRGETPTDANTDYASSD